MLEEAEVILHLGSNLGDRRSNLSRVIELLSTHFEPLTVSSIFETDAWGVIDQDPFYNQAVRLNTTLSPIDLLSICRNIGLAFPEKKGQRWGPRYMDIDIIFFGEQIIETNLLKIPHPRMHLRNFVLIPLLEIAPNYIHPVLNKTVEELYLESSDYLDVRILN